MKANELKVTDLMVEDWVICYHPSRPQSFERVSVGLLHTLDQQEHGHIKEDNPLFRIVQPIPLTPEILKKNGFVNSYIDESLNKDSVYKYNHFYTGNSVIVDMESNKLIVKYENNIWMNLPYNRTIYVHELQHVLKHCDIKKEIII